MFSVLVFVGGKFKFDSARSIFETVLYFFQVSVLNNFRSFGQKSTYQLHSYVLVLFPISDKCSNVADDGDTNNAHALRPGEGRRDTENQPVHCSHCRRGRCRHNSRLDITSAPTTRTTEEQLLN
ncbi:unnamed protein product [Leptidea sinapis]|uniref:Uncharacterized protein n=1 Tax=Leptidea sinapis TaxID=189913 RepID=A0A5E4QE23_9NEOP|nr:unnamed protein product [Leptidea sinapis]